MSEKVIYFAYGSNMSSARLCKRISSAKFLCRARLHNKRMICNKRGEDGSGKANLTDSPGNLVWGALYEIDSAELEQLDRIEGGYERVQLEVTTDQNSLVLAHVYTSNDLTGDARPYDWYKELMMQGAREHRLPAHYTTQLEQINSKPSTAGRTGCNQHSVSN